MKYIDTSLRDPSQTVAIWLQSTLEKGIVAVRCQSGYFTREGASLLFPVFRECASSGAKVSLLFGSNSGATLASHISYVAGALGLPQPNVELGIVSFKNALFHPKVYHFEHADGSQTAYIGSANMTASAISGLNIEAGIILSSSEGDDPAIFASIVGRIDSWFDERPASLSVIQSIDDIEFLIRSELLALDSKRTSSRDEEDQDGGSNERGSTAILNGLAALPQLPPLAAIGDITSGGDHPIATPTVAVAAPVPYPTTGDFLRPTEASFHYPQGTHLGHIFSILWHFSGDRGGTPFDDQFIRINGSLGEGRLAAYRRQVKYKLLAAMELGLLQDARFVAPSPNFIPQLTQLGRRLWAELTPFIDPAFLVGEMDEDGIFSSETPIRAREFNGIALDAQGKSPSLAAIYRRTFFTMPAVQQLLWGLYRRYQVASIEKQELYADFFELPPVVEFCNLVGIEPQTHEAARHRVPFLVNILESLGVVQQTSAAIEVVRFAPTTAVMQGSGEPIGYASSLLADVQAAWPSDGTKLSAGNLANLRGKFGPGFLSATYYLKAFEETSV